MDPQVNEKMKAEILETAKNIGSWVGVGFFLLLGWIGTRIASVDVVLKSDAWYWPLGLFVAIAGFVGYRSYLARKEMLAKQIAGMSDDALRLAYDKVREKRTLNKALNYVIIAAVVLYFLLR